MKLLKQIEVSEKFLLHIEAGLIGLLIALILYVSSTSSHLLYNIEIFDWLVLFTLLPYGIYISRKALQIENLSSYQNRIINCFHIFFESLMILGFGIRFSSHVIRKYAFFHSDSYLTCSDDVYDFIWFLNGFLGPLLLFLGLFGLFALIVTKEFKVENQTYKLNERIILFFAWDLLGGIIGFIMVEFTYSILFEFLAIFSIASIIILALTFAFMKKRVRKHIFGLSAFGFLGGIIGLATAYFIVGW